MDEKLEELTEKFDTMAKTVNTLKVAANIPNLLIDQIHTTTLSVHNTREYTFYTCSGTYSGRISEIGDDYVRIRLSSDSQGAYEDIFVNMNSVCAVKEMFSRE